MDCLFNTLEIQYIYSVKKDKNMYIKIRNLFQEDKRILDKSEKRQLEIWIYEIIWRTFQQKRQLDGFTIGAPNMPSKAIYS